VVREEMGCEGAAGVRRKLEIGVRTQPLVTVFTSTVYPDLVRIWHACASRAFPADEAVLEIFQDSEDNALCASLLPGVTVLRRTASRRDFHDAYNDALARASTPYLAFIDSDVFWTSVGLWDRVRKQLASQTTAAVSCVSRTKTASHGTFAVVMKVAVYREVLERFPDGFYPAIEVQDLSIPMERW